MLCFQIQHPNSSLHAWAPGKRLCHPKADFSSEEFTRALLKRIQAHENRVQAFQWIDFDRALGLSRQADERRRSGAPLGPLHGIGVGIKDIIETRNIPTTMGSAIYEGFCPGTVGRCGSAS